MPVAMPLPERNGLDGGQRSRGVLFWSMASVAVSALMYAWIWFVGRGYEELFRGFGSALPWLTRLVLATYEFYGLLLLVGLVPCVVLVRMPATAAARSRSLHILVTLGFALACLSVILFYTAIYLPVFQMGSPVH